MINTNELRIGNLFHDKFTKEVFTVEMISKEQIHFDYVTCSNWQAEPIPLTEEWFLKFGFEFDTIDWQFPYPSCYFIGWYAGKWCLGTQSDGVLKETYFEYVHQLQNLFFCLCGKELTQVSEGKNKNFV